jgi:hypothetical protein
VVTQTLQRPVEKAVEKAKELVEHEKQAAKELTQRVEPHSPVIAMALALASMIGAVTLFLRKSRESAIFVGLWAPTILTLGLFYLLMGKKRQD